MGSLFSKTPCRLTEDKSLCLMNHFDRTFAGLTYAERNAIERMDLLGIKAILSKDTGIEETFETEQRIDITKPYMILFAVCMTRRCRNLAFVTTIGKPSDLNNLDVLLLGLYYRRDIATVRVEFAHDFRQDFEFMVNYRTSPLLVVKRHMLAVVLYNLAFDYSIGVDPRLEVCYDHNTYKACLRPCSMGSRATGMLSEQALFESKVLAWPEAEAPYNDLFKDTNSIAFGAFGIVYRGKAFAPLEFKDVALKLFTLNSSDNGSTWRDYIGIVNELKMWLHLIGDKYSLIADAGQHIIPLYAIYETPSERRVIAAMPLMDKSLDETTEYPLRARWKIVASMCHCLRAVHAKSVAHGDVKLGNFLIGVDGRVFISDFGESVLVEKDPVTKSVEFPDDPDYEVYHKGSYEYHPPEVVRYNKIKDSLGEEEDAGEMQFLRNKIFEKDIWALGASIYILIYGKLVDNDSEMQSDDAYAFDPSTPDVLRRMLSHSVSGDEFSRPDIEQVCYEMDLVVDKKTKTIQ